MSVNAGHSAEAAEDAELREYLGRLVREEWIAWARTQPNPKPSWLVPWDELSEPDKEVDRRIGERLARWGMRIALASDALKRERDQARRLRELCPTITRFLEELLGLQGDHADRDLVKLQHALAELLNSPAVAQPQVNTTS